MWVTAVTIMAFCIYLTVLVKRRKYFYLHSFFLIPIYPVIFFIDHNAYYVVSGLQSDSVHYAVKLLPLYLNIIYLLFLFRQRRHKTLALTPVLVNGYLAYNLVLSVVTSYHFESWLPFFYMSYSAPVFALFYNARNFAEEAREIRLANCADKVLLQGYFAAFVLIYAISLAYAMGTGITESLLSSRSVGSVFASTSAVVYCVLYAPVLASLSDRKWPHIVTLVISVTSLSKTALLLLPSYAIALFKFMKRSLRVAFWWGLALAIGSVFLLPLVPESVFEMWAYKVAVEGHETFLDKAYRTRADLYRDAFEVIKDHPLGIGVGNFEHFTNTGYRDSHNFIINSIAESGWVVGTMLIGVLFASFVRVAIDIRKGSFEFQHASLLAILLIYPLAGGVLLTTGNSELSTVYYTPFYGVAIFQFLSLLDRTPHR